MSKLSFATLTIKKRGDAIAGHLYRHKGYNWLYLAGISDSSGNIRLYSLRDGNAWSHTCTFGRGGAEDFTDLGKIQVEEL